MKERIIRALLRIYSAAWRKEYGAELRDVLEARSLKGRTVFNVAWNAAWQRLCATEPWVLLGLTMAIYGTVLLSQLIVAPPPYAPEYEMGFPGPWRIFFELLLVSGCGFWTVVRSGGTLPHAGVQAMKMVLLVSVPSAIVCTLVLTSALGVIVLGPGDTPTTFAEHGFAIAWYDANRVAPNALFLLLIRIPGVLESWIWGALGGALGRLVRRKLQPAD